MRVEVEVEERPDVGPEPWFAVVRRDGAVVGMSVGGHVSPDSAIRDAMLRVDSGQIGTESETPMGVPNERSWKSK